MAYPELGLNIFPKTYPLAINKNINIYITKKVVKNIIFVLLTGIQLKKRAKEKNAVANQLMHLFCMIKKLIRVRRLDELSIKMEISQSTELTMENIFGGYSKL